ncbi:MAG TPA: sulfatase-like hydrolase/transferase, partial [Polyangiales bacterium]|nr:sulfatase-like hydrolase/transferase [Polyangiales bacterium]
LLARLLWSGGKMSRLRYQPLGIVLSALALSAGLMLAIWLSMLSMERARAGSAQRVFGLWLANGFALGKLNQWLLPNLYDYLHTALSLASYACYALAALALSLRIWAAKPLRFSGVPLIALALGCGFVGLRTLDQNQNVRVALMSANMPHSRSLLLGAAPLLPRVETRSADLATQRAAAARARRARVAHDSSLPQLPDAHVLLITIDALRADHLSSYGYGRPLSKEIAALADEGQLFERAYAQAPHSSYSLCSLFSSEYLHETTELGAAAPEATLPRALAEDGYHSAAFYTQGIFHTAAERLSSYEQDAFGFALHDHQDRPPEQMTDRVLSEIDRTVERGEPNALFWVHYFNVHEP